MLISSHQGWRIVQDSTQVLVIGGGPAGSTAAGLLVRQGFQVSLAERERFPRYHIGESILPAISPILDLLGAKEKVTAHGFQPKGGTFFFWGDEEWDIQFADLGGGRTSAWQVVRSEFDQLLLEHAKSLGVRVHEGVTVRDVEFTGDRAAAARWVRTDDPSVDGRISFDYLIDASGRGGVLAARHFKNRRFHDVFKNVAAWAYWAGGKKLTKGPDGAIAVCSIPRGWFWVIPLHDGTYSVGLVTGKDIFNGARNRLGSVEAVYAEAMRECPAVLDLLENATRVSDMRVEQDYSYVAEQFAGPGYLLSGDAACFLDPLLSTGVHLATYSALLAAASVGSILRGEVTEADALTFYNTWYRHAYERLLVLVSVFYESYRGKDYHFYNAQRLTQHEQSRLHLHEAFLHIITGVEDLADAQDAAFSLVKSELSGANSGNPIPMVNYNEAKKDRPTAPSAPELAVRGLYLATKPELALRWADPHATPVGVDTSDRSSGASF